MLLGDTGVGKSSLALRFSQGRFPPFHEVTIGAAFLQQIVRVDRGRQLKLYIWDTGGQERSALAKQGEGTLDGATGARSASVSYYPVCFSFGDVFTSQV